MQVSEFDYHLPPELIAQKPLPERDGSRMMVIHRASGEIQHSHFSEFPKSLQPGDVLVLNDTRVYPARVWGRKDEIKIEFLFLKEQEQRTWEVLCRPAKKVRLGDSIHFSPSLEGQVIGVGEEGKRLLLFASRQVLPELKKIGYAPLPPYIKRSPSQTGLRDMDRERYQTVFARKEGAIAAPTAGLHFTPETLRSIQDRGIFLTPITLDVGLATFQPVRVRKIESFRMLQETYSISRPSALVINEAKKEGRPVTAVGTTSVRTLESAFLQGEIRSGSRTTDLFIFPGYSFQVVNRLLTNFHLPKSTLLMMIAALAGIDLIKKAYMEAVQKKYRFYSYGDCMLII
jgi:S-adenosylmethionine:tRNA ribosyltransferase-isomerase